MSVLLSDLRDERSASVPFPPGETRFSMGRTRRFASEPLDVLLESYERFGPIFTLRLFHGNVVFMLGPAARPWHTDEARGCPARATTRGRSSAG